MKTLPHFSLRCRGFTLPELLISMAVLSVVGLAFAAFSTQALRTFTWLTATNVAHQSARSGIQHMLVDIHESPSPIMLLNLKGEKVAGVNAPKAGTYWGILYQRLIHGPLQVANNLSAGATTMQLRVGSAFTPSIGQLICLPNSSNLYRITAVGALSGNNRPVTITPGIQASDVLSVAGPGTYDATDGSDGGTEVIAVYVVQRSAYVVRPTAGQQDVLELRHYPMVLQWTSSTKPDGLLWGPGDPSTSLDDLYYYIPATPNGTTNALTNPSTYSVVSRGLRGVEIAGMPIGPFSDPTTAGGAPNRRAVAAVQLSLQDSNVSNLIDPEQASVHTLSATTLFLNAMIPQRHLVTNRN